MRRLLSYLLIVAVLLSVTFIGTTSVYAEQSGDFTYTIINKTVTIIQYRGNGGEVTIPSKLAGYPVTNIGDSAFYNYRGGTNVCPTKIIIPYGITTISTYAFRQCDSLNSISIPNSVKIIGDFAFEGCESLTSFTIPKSVTSIGDSSFNTGIGLVKINVDSNNPKFTSENGVLFNKAKTAIIKCPSELKGSYNIPITVSNIENSAFSYCNGLTKINIPSTVTKIGKNAFENCTGLTGIIIPNMVTSIEYSAFDGCTGLTIVNIPSRVTSIGGFAFYGCSGLTSLTLPSAVKSIGMNAFSECKKLIIYCEDKSYTQQYMQEYVKKDYGAKFVTKSGYLAQNGDLIYIVSKNTATIVHYTGKGGNLIIPSKLGGYKVAEIGDYAFWFCDKLTRVVVPNTVTRIGEWAFDYCEGINNITLSSSLTTIGDYAFTGCTGLTDITLPNSLLKLGKRAFENCVRLRSIVIPNKITSIGEMTFQFCDSLTTIIIPNSVVEIGPEAFYNTPWIKNYAGDFVIVGNNILIQYKGSSSSVIIPNNTRKISGYVFYHLTSVTIPSSVISIGENVFNESPNLNIYGADKSYAQQYAQKNNISFVVN